MVLSERQKKHHRKLNLKNKRDSKVHRNFRCCLRAVSFFFFLLHKSGCEGKIHNMKPIFSLKHGHRRISSQRYKNATNCFTDCDALNVTAIRFPYL